MKDEKEVLLACYIMISHNVKEMKDNVTSPETVHALCMYGLGVIDAVCVFSKEFLEYREKAMDKDDNDVQAFLCAAKAFHDWMMSKGHIPTDFVSDAVAG